MFDVSWHEMKYVDAREADLVSINAFGKVIVVINTAKAAQALLEQRSAIYSDRPFLTIVTL